MEEINKSPHKKKSPLGLTVGDAGGIGGVVLLGGGLAVAGLLAAFTIIKSKNRRQDGKNEDPTTPSNQKQDESQGLSFVLQSPPTIVQHQNSCCTSHALSKVAVTVNPIASCELVSTHTLGDKPMITDGKEENPSNNHLEILISDDSKTQSTASSCEILNRSPNVAPLDTPENLIKNVFSENLQSIETTEAQKEDEPTVAEKLEVQEKTAMQSVEVEEEENGDDSATELVIEKEEENGDDSARKHVLEKEEENADDSTRKHFIEREENDDDITTKHIMEKEENGDDTTTEIVIEKEENDDDSTTEHVTEKEEESSEGILAVKENSPGQSVEKAADEYVKKENESMEAENLAPEEALPVRSGVKEEDEDDVSEVNVSEKEEESSEGEPSVEENSAMQSTEEEEEEGEVEEDDEEDDDNNNHDFSIEEHVMEKEDESSDGTGCSSMESNAEAVWPAEMIEVFSHELKEMNVGDKDSGEKIIKPVNHNSLDFNSGGNSFSEDDNSDGTTENFKTIMANAQTVHSPSRRRHIWFWSLIMVALLVLLLHIHHTAVLDDLTHPDPVMVP